ncbi:ATP-binding protein [Listeria booriae]|uniref:ATP-binding protein n=1 Tax=Listeria booriae TaxID=1552123 RepID=UPI00164DA625|nr:DUF87 domain-containing protein [Listeria booriae]MBC6164639.1 ATP-binding protein [Listeria booriae]
MLIDDFYNKHDRGNFYLGLVSRVQRDYCTVQVENLSLLSARLLGEDNLAPNTIDYLVLIDSEEGLFVGTVFQAHVKSSDAVHKTMDFGKSEAVYPELLIELNGLIPRNSNSLELSGYSSVGITNKVYIGNEKLIKMFVESQEINKSDDESTLSFASLSRYKNASINLKTGTIFNRHLMAIGTTGSGKSTSSLTVLDKLVEQQKKFLMIDATGEYKSAFCDNEVERLILGVDTQITPGTLSIPQWIGLFEASPGIQAPSLMKAITSLRYQYAQGKTGVYTKIGKQTDVIQQQLATLTEMNREFDLNYLAAQLVEESIKEGDKYGKPTGIYIENTFNLNANQYLIDRINFKLTMPSFKDFFCSVLKYSLINKLEEFLGNSKRLMIDASLIDTSDATGGIIIDLVAQTLLNNGNKESQAFVFFVDEVHRYTKSLATDGENYYNGLIAMAREGRKKGQYLFLTTQSPHDVSKMLLGQMGTLLIHRLTQPEELQVIRNYLDDKSLHQIKKLGRGEAILTSVNLLQNLQLKMKRTKREHYNSSPSL